MPAPLLALAILPPLLAAPWRVGPTPGWVVSVDAPLETPAGDGGSGLRYLLFDEQLRLDGEGAALYSSLVRRAETRSALAEVARAEIAFDPIWESVTLHRLEVLRSGAWADRLADAEIAAAQVDGVESALTIAIPDVAVGDAVRLDWTVEGGHPAFGERYVGGFDMAWSVPNARRHLAIQWSERDAPKIQPHGALPEPETPGPRALRWDLRDLPGIAAERDLPADALVWPWVQIAEFASWAEVVDWALPLYAPAPAPTIQALAQSLAASSPEATLLASLRWVQDEIDYLAADAGARSHAPAAPGDVLAERRGDCKDKSRLLVALLAEQEIAAWPALVDTGGAPTRWAPSPAAFDHVIVRAEIDGEAIWVDPTLDHQGGPLSASWIPDYGEGLVVRAGEVGLASIPPAPPGSAHATRRYVLDGDELALSVTTRRAGARAQDLRAELAANSLEVIERRALERYIALGRPVQSAAPMQIRDDRAADVIVTTEAYRVRSLGPPGRLEVYPLGLLAALPDAGDRVGPLALSRGREVEVVEVVAPGLSLPAVEAEISAPWFSLTATSEEIADGIAITYRLEITADRVESEGLAAYRAARAQVVGSRGYGVALSVASEGATASGLEEAAWWWVVVGVLVGVGWWRWSERADD